ncbi:MAG: ABC transporter ATP-binding protein [Furfurilactobacillus sp.]|jgi:ABC-2 type transport system ATP-binding protein|uniref:ABC transporter ATP-binding protein n=1 Tax=Furfurilactobacillus milii TaxID=2888272 RepID=A0ABT6DBW8_9LACO|nr:MULTISPECIES: ABC transporter ATP-binding protein [Furfurilactobacillus]QLE67461.1 ABC transporter ATP-binding protein [Furfurilactobacillus rossiae]MCF6161678.1 ABC transporter ATP-binding protein [Furfurilactobacillus milii]MCF6164099.1 ABC transporter ATP-binding protein [Furfurilactobacillus milii]MCF6419459.1 ABC transporter ATP-binding protein [Furfurilactobacillus milii]MCH4011593.1 ABC transporter ATP-binding protein [Furfurilactobacillus sp.]
MQLSPVIHVSHLQKRFGKFQALHDVTFDVQPGEVFGFIGPNGAGKSTTIRTLLGLLRASGGTATIFGKDVFHDAVSIHKNIAYVPGDVYLWPNLTGGEIIDLFLRLSQQRHSKRTDELIKAFGLDTSKKARTYSKGNRQKVALIAALSQSADLYIFDEPTSGLDPLNEQVFQDEVKALKAAGKAILLSSHILSEVEQMCDRIGIIREGQIIETGTLTEMQHLTRTQISVTTKSPLTDLTDQPGVHQLKQTGKTAATFAVDSEAMTTVTRYLAEHQILTLKSTPPTLEDLFLRYYSQQPDQTNSKTGDGSDA